MRRFNSRPVGDVSPGIRQDCNAREKEPADKIGEEKLFDGDANPGEGIFIEVYPALTGADRACLRTNDAGSRTGRSRLSGHRST